jgi:hypothetical protein
MAPSLRDAAVPCRVGWERARRLRAPRRSRVRSMSSLRLLALVLASCASASPSLAQQDAAVARADRTLVRAAPVAMRHVGARTRPVTVADVRVQEASHGSRQVVRPLRVHFRH